MKKRRPAWGSQGGGVALMVDREQRLQAKPLHFHQNTHHFIPPHPTIHHITPLHPAPPAHSISPQLTPLISMAVKVTCERLHLVSYGRSTLTVGANGCEMGWSIRLVSNM